jgi:hypothetical protein
MLKRILQTSIRNLASRKGFALLNVGGLVLGVSCFILIGLYVQQELSYDRHHEKADQIHRLGLHIFLDGTESNFATVSAPLARGLVDHFPEVKASARVNKGGFPVLRYPGWLRLFSAGSDLGRERQRVPQDGRGRDRPDLERFKVRLGWAQRLAANAG